MAEPRTSEPGGRGGRRERHHVDLNHASVEKIASLPALGDEHAREIVRYRPYASWDEVARVPGMTAELVDAVVGAGASIDPDSQVAADSEALEVAEEEGEISG